MPRALRASCTRPGCPRAQKPGSSKCTECTADAEEARGTARQRGYGKDHEARRAALEPKVAAGQVTCWRCGHTIQPGERWDLGHDDHDRSQYRGPEHAGGCNRSAAGRASHGLTWRPQPR